MPIDTSKDILYIVISICILWVTVFLCWMLYYVMRLLKNTNEIVEEFRVRLQVLTDAIHYIRSKVEIMSNLMTMAKTGVGGVVKRLVSKKANEWMAAGGNAAESAAKTAVERAVAATAKKISKVAKKVKP